MILIVKIFAVLLMVAGLLIIVMPNLLKRLLSSMKTKGFVNFAIIIRLLIGAFLIWGALQFQWHEVVIVIGILIFLAGVVGIFMGYERLFRLIDWFAQRSPLAIRLLGLTALLLGTILFIAVG
jgi:hypothetical protein